MRGLIFLVLGAGVVEVGELVEGQLAVALGPAGDLLGLIPAGSLGQGAHARVAGVGAIALAEPAAAGDLLQRGVGHALHQAALESLVEIAHRVQLAA